MTRDEKFGQISKFFKPTTVWTNDSPDQELAIRSDNGLPFASPNGVERGNLDSTLKEAIA